MLGFKKKKKRKKKESAVWHGVLESCSIPKYVGSEEISILNSVIEEIYNKGILFLSSYQCCVSQCGKPSSYTHSNSTEADIRVKERCINEAFVTLTAALLLPFFMRVGEREMTFNEPV